MTCGGCTNQSDDLRSVPGGGKLLYCRDCRKSIAAQHGRTSMSHRTEAQKSRLGELGGNALLKALGVQYYGSLGSKLKRRVVEVSIGDVAGV